MLATSQVGALCGTGFAAPDCLRCRVIHSDGTCQTGCGAQGLVVASFFSQFSVVTATDMSANARQRLLEVVTV